MDLGPGQVVDRYTVVDKIGRGGMAEVYRVRHNTLGTDHALKVLSLNIPSIRERLIQEGRVQALLQHPHIVAVTDVLDVQGSPGLLMQLVKGPSLEDWLSCNRPSLPEALRIFRAILEALEEAHRLEIVHRDLKPGNVMLSTQRGVLQPKVTDFGLAKLLAEEASPTRTRTGLPMGTPAYMSPEQITDAKTVDLRTDIFALGCILYELTCGQMAFIGANTLEVFNAVAGGDYAPPRTLVPDLPDPVVRAIHGCLQQQRELRIPSCEALAAVLDGGPLGLRDAPTIGLAPGEALGSQPGQPSQPSGPPLGRSSASPTFAPIEPPDGSLAPPEPAAAPTPRPPTERGPSRGWLLLLVAVLVLMGLATTLAGGGLLTWWAARSRHDLEQAQPELEPSAPVDIVHSPETPPEAPVETVTTVEPPPPSSPAVDRPEAQVPEAAPTTGLVVVDGDARSVMLIDSQGQRHPPGRLAPGTYDLEASFASGATIRQPDRVTVRAGRTVRLRCVALMETCN